MSLILTMGVKQGLDTPLFPLYYLVIVVKIYKIWRYPITLEKPVYSSDNPLDHFLRFPSFVCLFRGSSQGTPHIFYDMNSDRYKEFLKPAWVAL